MLADKGRSTESINTFSKASNEASADDCLIMGKLFLQKNLLAQAKYWFSQSSTRSDRSPTQPLIGLLRVAQMEKNDEDAETVHWRTKNLYPVFWKQLIWQNTLPIF